MTVYTKILTPSIVGNDNCVRFDNLVLQIPADRHRCHYVKARVWVNRYPDGRLAIFHGPRKLATYDAQGRETRIAIKADAPVRRSATA